MVTPLSRYQYVFLWAAIAATVVGFVTAVVCKAAGLSPGLIWLTSVVAALVGVHRARSIGVTVAGDSLVVCNPIRTYRIPIAELAGIRGATTPWYVSGGWAPALVTRNRSKPLLLAGLLVPRRRFDGRPWWRLGFVWSIRWDTAPDTTYRHAGQFQPLAEIVAVNQIFVSREWQPLLAPGRRA